MEITTSDGDILVVIAILPCSIKIGKERTKIPFSKPFKIKSSYLYLSDLVKSLLVTFHREPFNLHSIPCLQFVFPTPALNSPWLRNLVPQNTDLPTSVL